MNVKEQGTIKVDDEDLNEGNAEELVQDDEQIAIEQMGDAIEEAKRIMLLFVGEHFGEDILNKVASVIDSLPIRIDRDPKTAELCSAYYTNRKDGRNFFNRKLL